MSHEKPENIESIKERRKAFMATCSKERRAALILKGFRDAFSRASVPLKKAAEIQRAQRDAKD